MRDGEFELVTLKSGSRAVRHLGHGEIMHPAGGPWTEANRLYIEQADLATRLSLSSAPVCIFDVGLGAATNAVAALTCAQQVGGALEVHSFERDLAPLRLALADPEGFPFLIPFHDAARTLMEKGEWHHGPLHWFLHHGELLECLPHAPQTAELIYYDPFSPKHNASLWTPEAFALLRKSCCAAAAGALLFTYSASTAMRVSLLLGGFFVGVGFSTGTKGETTVAATQKSALREPLSQRWLARWERSSTRAPIGSQALLPEHEAALRAHSQFAQQ